MMASLVPFLPNIWSVSIRSEVCHEMVFGSWGWISPVFSAVELRYCALCTVTFSLIALNVQHTFTSEISQRISVWFERKAYAISSMFSTGLHVYVPMTSDSLFTRLAQCHVYASCSVLMQMRFQGDLLKDQIHAHLIGMWHLGINRVSLFREGTQLGQLVMQWTYCFQTSNYGMLIINGWRQWQHLPQLLQAIWLKYYSDFRATFSESWVS